MSELLMLFVLIFGIVLAVMWIALPFLVARNNSLQEQILKELKFQNQQIRRRKG